MGKQNQEGNQRKLLKSNVFCPDVQISVNHFPSCRLSLKLCSWGQFKSALICPQWLLVMQLTLARTKSNGHQIVNTAHPHKIPPYCNNTFPNDKDNHFFCYFLAFFSKGANSHTSLEHKHKLVENLSRSTSICRGKWQSTFQIKTLHSFPSMDADWLAVFLEQFFCDRLQHLKSLVSPHEVCGSITSQHLVQIALIHLDSG